MSSPLCACTMLFAKRTSSPMPSVPAMGEMLPSPTPTRPLTGYTHTPVQIAKAPSLLAMVFPVTLMFSAPADHTLMAASGCGTALPSLHGMFAFANSS